MQQRYLLVSAGLLASLVSLGCADFGEPQLSADHAAIIGGVPDYGRDYVVGVGSATSPWCSATVISERTVLTAGHCAVGIERVFFGPNWAGPPVPAVVVEEVAHPDWSLEPFSWQDVALVKLAEPAPVQPVPLLRQRMSNTPAYVGPDFTWVGYGIDDVEEETGTGLRRVVVFPIAAVDVDIYNGQQSDEVLVIYDQPNKGTGRGDSGGPAFYVGADGVERQAALSSRGGYTDSYIGMHVRADAYMQEAFIQGVIDQFEPDNPCRADGLCPAECDSADQLRDPDCAPHHCGADGLCVISCVHPLDPDCRARGLDHCVEDGVCDPECAPEDVDCGRVVVETPDAGPAGPDAGPPASNADAGASAESGEGGGCAVAAQGGSSGILVLLLVFVAARRRPRWHAP